MVCVTSTPSANYKFNVNIQFMSEVKRAYRPKRRLSFAKLFFIYFHLFSYDVFKNRRSQKQSKESPKTGRYSVILNFLANPCVFTSCLQQLSFLEKFVLRGYTF